MNASIRVAALVALLFTTAAFADDPDFSKLDADGDKRISREEVKADADLSARFDEIDSDKDGSLNDSEWKADEKSRREKRQQRREDR